MYSQYHSCCCGRTVPNGENNCHHRCCCGRIVPYGENNCHPWKLLSYLLP